MTARWETKTLEEIAFVGAGNPAPQKKSMFEGGNLPFYRTSDVGQIRFGEISTAVDLLNDQGASGLRLVPSGTVLVPKSGASTFLNHRVITCADGYVSSHLATVTARPHVALPRFLLYALARVQAQELLPENSYPSLNLSLIKGIKLSFPPLDEQQRIVAVLDEAFEGLARARAHAEANLKNARELFESAIEAALERAGGEPVLLQEMIDAGMITSHLDGNHGGDYPRKEEFVSEGVPYISANCIAGNEIDFGRCKYLTPERADGLRKGIAKNRDVLFAHNATVGPVTLLRTDEEKVILSTSLTYYRCNEDELIPEFLVCEMRSAGFRRQYEAVMAQATRNQVPITMQRKFTHLIPPLAEQRRIAELGVELEAICNSAIKSYEASLQDLDDLRQSLLQKSFAGELT